MTPQLLTDEPNLVCSCMCYWADVAITGSKPWRVISPLLFEHKVYVKTTTPTITISGTQTWICSLETQGTTCSCRQTSARAQTIRLTGS